MALEPSQALYAEDHLSPQALLNHVEQIHRAESSFAKIQMTIKNSEGQRPMSFDAWSLGKDYTLIRITAPKKDKGIATLRRDKEMWNFLSQN